MDSTARLVAALDGRGRTVPTTLFGEAPLLLRVTSEDTGAGSGLEVHLVGGAAGPLCGDRLRTSIDVGAGAALTVRSVAASLAQPGPCGSSGSTATVGAVLAAGASLDWWPEPLVSVRGSDHTLTTTVDIDVDAGPVRWVDEVVLGRHDEVGGRLSMHQRFSVGGRPILRHSVTFDPATAGIGRHGSARVAVTAVAVGGPVLTAASSIEAGLRVVRYPLNPACTAWIALGDDLDRARDALARLGLERASGILDDPATAFDRYETSA